MKFKPERVRNILSKLNNNKGLEETRGGDQVSHKSLAKKQSVRKFIGSLKGTESHYSRSKSKRVYLRSDLSIRKLHTIYNDCQENRLLKVTPSMFRKIFCGEFNLGFKSPATDICGYCAMLDNKLKNASPAEKQILFTEKRESVFMNSYGKQTKEKRPCVLTCNRYNRYRKRPYNKLFTQDNLDCTTFVLSLIHI